MQVRKSYENFELAAARYFDNLLPLLADLQFTRGGPIIAVQVSGCHCGRFLWLLSGQLYRSPLGFVFPL